MDKTPYKGPKESPAVLLSLPSLRTPRKERRVRVIQYSKSGPLLDIREFLNTPNSTRFTKKGLTFTYQEILELEKILTMARNFIETDLNPNF